MRGRRTRIRSRFLQAEEGNIFVLGCCMLILWVETMAALWQLGHPLWYRMLSVGFAHMVAGRAVSIAHGVQLDLPRGLIALLATYTDTMAMFILYPVFVYSYRNFFEGRFFQKHMRPVFERARRSANRFRGFKIASLFLFVWFPFWMTGIIMGAVVGFLLGMRTWVIMVTVVSGTAAVVISWVYAYDLLFGWLSDVHQTIPVALVLLLLAGLVVARWLRARNGIANSNSAD